MTLDTGTVDIPVSSSAALIPHSAATAATSAAVASHNPRARKLRSLVWNDFTKERRPDGSYVAICNHCKKQLTASSRSGTTHLRNHLAICLSTKRPAGPGRRKKLIVRRLLPHQTRKFDPAAVDPDDPANSAADAVAGLTAFDQETSRADLARMIVRHGYRFSMVEDSGFRTFVHNLQPKFKMVAHDVVKADCMKIYDTLRVKLHDSLLKLPSRVSLSVDMWRSSTGSEYICLTCHYIEQQNLNDDWNLRKKIVNFLHIDSPLSPDEICRKLLDNIQEWGVDKKLTAVLLDNCAFGDSVGQEILQSLRSKRLLLSNGELFLVQSCAHILNLTVQESPVQAAELTKKVRMYIQYIKFSQDRFIKFQKMAKQMGVVLKPIVLDSANNWASIYSMFESACHYQDALEAFVRLAEWDPGYEGYLTAKDWADVRTLHEILDIFYHTMKKFQSVEKPTANLYFNEICDIHLLLKSWCTSTSVVSSIASQMLLKLEKYWNLTKNVMAVASILDPRYKMKSVEYYFKLIYNDHFGYKSQIEGIQNIFVSLYNQYAAQSASSSKNPAVLCYAGAGGTSTSGPAYGNGSEDSKTFSRITLNDARKGLDEYIQNTSATQSFKTDLDMYLEEPVVYRLQEEIKDRFDILGWWRSFSAKYPVLSVMARDVLAIPVSIVPLDSEVRVLDEYLSTMDPVTVERLICAQDWLKDEPEVSVGAGDVLAALPAPNSGMDGAIGSDECMMNTQVDDFSASPK